MHPEKESVKSNSDAFPTGLVEKVIKQVPNHMAGLVSRIGFFGEVRSNEEA